MFSFNIRLIWKRCLHFNCDKWSHYSEKLTDTKTPGLTAVIASPTEFSVPAGSCLSDPSPFLRAAQKCLSCPAWGFLYSAGSRVQQGIRLHWITQHPGGETFLCASRVFSTKSGLYRQNMTILSLVTDDPGSDLAVFLRKHKFYPTNLLKLCEITWTDITMSVLKEFGEIRISAEKSEIALHSFYSSHKLRELFFLFWKHALALFSCLYQNVFFSLLSVFGWLVCLVFFNRYDKGSLKELYRAQTREEAIYFLGMITSSGLLSLPWSVPPESIFRAVCSTDETQASLLVYNLKY